MNIIEFIETQYPIKDRVRAKLEDPYARVANMDDLPYDKIGPDEYGKPTKLVEVDDERYISVMDLIGMSKDEVDKTGDTALQNVWEVYMSQIDLQDINIIDIMECVKQHQNIVRVREEQLGVLSL
jgi:hypothetical protein